MKNKYEKSDIASYANNVTFYDWRKNRHATARGNILHGIKNTLKLSKITAIYFLVQ